jgi:hypothetical protein
MLLNQMPSELLTIARTSIVVVFSRRLETPGLRVGAQRILAIPTVREIRAQPRPRSRMHLYLTNCGLIRSILREQLKSPTPSANEMRINLFLPRRSAYPARSVIHSTNHKLVKFTISPSASPRSLFLARPFAEIEVALSKHPIEF